MADLLDSIAPDVDLNAEPEVVEETPAPEPQLDLTPKEESKEVVKEQQKEAQKLVPLEALHESRIKEREWRDKAAQIEKESQERFQKLEQRLEKLVNPPPEIPRFEDDPAGHLMHEVEATKAELASVRQQSEQFRQIKESETFEQQIVASTQAAEVEFSKDHPDYLLAVQYLQTIANKNLQMMGLDDPSARVSKIREDALAMSLKSFQMGKSPAEVAYQLALNYGYKAGSGQAKEASDVAKKIDALNEGKKTASLPAGGSKQTPLTLAALEQMDDDEFNKLVDDPAQWKKLISQMT